MKKSLRAGTRGSALALRQTDIVRKTLSEISTPVELETVVIRTTGDMRQGTPAASTLDKKAWIRELESSVLQGDVDFAIHSGKDVPFDIEPGTTLLPITGRANPRDCFIGRLLPDGSRTKFSELSKGAKVGTASLRRRASLLRMRPDLSIVEHRGNIQTRIRKLDDSEDLDGIILACAGIDRSPDIAIKYEALDAKEFIPAIAQGSLIAQYKEENEEVAGILKMISSEVTQAVYQAERACAETLQVSCHTVLGVFGELVGNQVELIARVLSADGSKSIEARGSMKITGELRLLGVEVANDLLEQGAEKLLRALP